MKFKDVKNQSTLNRGWLSQLMKLSIRWPFDASAMKDISLTQAWGMWGDRSKNPLTAHPRSYWSQSDEDGIIEQILKRIQMPPQPTFIEFGVDDGTECNTVALLATEWKGCWVGGQDLIVDTAKSNRLTYIHDWITADNILKHVDRAQTFLSSTNVNLCSLDLDGNDYHFSKQLLESGFKPDVWVAEYNGTFPLGSRWVMPYTCDHAWKRGSDYFGASFTSFVELFAEHGYSPVATSVTGANLFLVRNDHIGHFSDVPQSLDEIFRPSLPFLISRKPFRRTAETIETLISG
jgi:hypothetical protein